MVQKKIERMQELYKRKGKHSNYQILATKLRKYLGEEFQTGSKYEYERLKYLTDRIDFKEKKVLDIGGNTGFFSLEICEYGVQKVDYYEGNAEHAEFVTLATQLLNLEQIVNVHPKYYLFEQQDEKYDVIFCLNVLHHLGHDFESGVAIEEAKKKIISYLNQMAYVTDILVFQMGFCWCGNIEHLLFEGGTKMEMEAFVCENTNANWEIMNIGIAEKKAGETIYVNLSEDNNVRVDAYGEFLNRPLFIMKSKVFNR